MRYTAALMESAFATGFDHRPVASLHELIFNPRAILMMNFLLFIDGLLLWNIDADAYILGAHLL